MKPPKARLIVISSAATLHQLETVLGQSEYQGHDLGTARSSGLMRKQSIWMREWPAEFERLEEPVDSMLIWLAAKVIRLTEIDKSIFLKLHCCLSSGDGNTFALSPQVAAKLVDLNILLLIEAPTLATSSSAA